jgi:signal transduction histidine kinase/DNA-binding response OmpR family regulator
MIIRQKIELFAIINQYFFVFVSFVGVLYFGGILNSCGLVFVGLVGALQSLFFLKPAQIRIIFTIYFLTVVVEAFLQPWLIPLPEITPKANLVLFVLHFLVVAFAIYTVLTYYITESIRIKEKEAKRLQELDTIKTNFFTNITHEFRTPLTVILGMSDLISKNSTQYLDHGLKLIHQNGIRLLHLINQILDLSKLEAKSMQNHFIQNDIISFLRQATEPFKHLADAKNIRFHFLSDFNIYGMDFDAEKITSLVSNLMSNAIKYSDTDSDIYFTVSEGSKNDPCYDSGFSPFPDRIINTDRILKLTVKDTGCGIAEHELPRIFDRYYQAENMHGNHQNGTGIGLLVVKELVNLLEGNLYVKSVPGIGSEFSVLLPVTNSASETEIYESVNSGYEELLQKDVENNDYRGTDIELPHLLIIEDNDDVVTYIRSVIGSKFLVERAVDGEQGIKMAIKMIPDMILADIMMPKKDGFKVCKTLKEDFRTSHIPLILLSAKADKESQINGIGCGADAYLSKPFNPKELMVRMKTLIETRKKLIAKYRTYAIATTNNESVPVNPDELFLRKLKEIMERNYEDDSFDTNQLTRNIGLSRVQLFRKLKALTGVSASHFIRFYRLSRAKEKIATTSENISQIAFGVGFKDPAYFTRAFNKEFGVTPSSLRE